jgi:hypothetical protein
MEQTSEPQTVPEGIPFVIKDPYNFEPECPLPRTALTCLNGLKHGATARMLFIPGEQPQDFYTLLAECFATHQPATSEDATLVTDAVLARWFLWRRQRAYSKREFEIYNEGDQEDSPSPSGLRELELFDRYRIQAERALKRALTNVQNLRKTAASEQKWRAQHELQKAKFDLERQRFELRQAQDARTAPKIEAEAAVDAHLAQNGLAALKGNQARQTANDPIMHENGEWVIRQHAWVSEPDGVRSLKCLPSNEKVQALVAQRASLVVPPVKVIRDFYFTTGFIPADYHWVFAGIDRASAVIPTDEPNPGLRCPMSFEKWQKLAAQEDPLLTAQPQRRKDAA